MLTTNTAATRAGVTRRAILKEISLGHLRAAKFGAAWAISEEDYTAWLAGRAADTPRRGRPPREPPKEGNEMPNVFTIEFAVPAPYNAGEWRISAKAGGKWHKIIGQPATGGTFVAHLPAGEYKQTYWSNGFPQSAEFSVTSTGAVVWSSEY